MTCLSTKASKSWCSCSRGSSSKTTSSKEWFVRCALAKCTGCAGSCSKHSPSSRLGCSKHSSCSWGRTCTWTFPSDLIILAAQLLQGLVLIFLHAGDALVPCGNLALHSALHHGVAAIERIELDMTSARLILLAKGRKTSTKTSGSWCCGTKGTCCPTKLSCGLSSASKKSPCWSRSCAKT